MWETIQHVTDGVTAGAAVWLALRLEKLLSHLTIRVEHIEEWLGLGDSRRGVNMGRRRGDPSQTRRRQDSRDSNKGE